MWQRAQEPNVVWGPPLVQDKTEPWAQCSLSDSAVLLWLRRRTWLVNENRPQGHMTTHMTHIQGFITRNWIHLQRLFITVTIIELFYDPIEVINPVLSVVLDPQKHSKHTDRKIRHRGQSLRHQRGRLCVPDRVLSFTASAPQGHFSGLQALWCVLGQNVWVKRQKHKHKSVWALPVRRRLLAGGQASGPWL